MQNFEKWFKKNSEKLKKFLTHRKNYFTISSSIGVSL